MNLTIPELPISQVLKAVDSSQSSSLQDIHTKVSDSLSWDDFLIIFDHVISHEYIHEELNGYQLTVIGENILADIELRENKLRILEDLNTLKLKQEIILGKWRLRTFWILFIFSILAFIYSTYDFITTHYQQSGKDKTIDSTAKTNPTLPALDNTSDSILGVEKTKSAK